MRKTVARTVLGGFVLFGASLGWGQSSVKSDLRLHAIVGAKIQVGNGQVIEKGTLVIRNGLIVAVGASVSVPAGAQILDGTGLTLFPGFIDAYATKGVKAPAAPADEDAPDPVSDYASASMREGNRKGMRPDLEVRTCLDLGDDLVKPYRKSGFTTVAFEPSGGTINGVGALVNLSGRPARESVVAARTAMAVGFGGGGDWSSYPGSLLGRVAFFRQTLLDAQRWLAVNRAYVAGGSERVASDPILEALAPVVRGELPTTIEADSPAQIDRALSLAEEFQLKKTLVGATNAYKRLPQIKESGADLILTLPFGEEPKKPETKDPKEDVKKTDGPAKDEAIPEPADRFDERLRLFNESVGNADAVRAAGIPFCFSTQGAKGPEEFMKALRVAVKKGLSREAALAGLTINPAKHFGLANRLGSLEMGKIANVVVMTGDFLDDEAEVKALFVDGYKLETKEEESGK